MNDSSGSQIDVHVGFLNFLPFAIGSKSQSIRPVLTLGPGFAYTVFKDGDNPFKNESLQEYDGKFVRVEGVLDTKRLTITAKSVVESQPAAGLDSASQDSSKSSFQLERSSIPRESSSLVESEPDARSGEDDSGTDGDNVAADDSDSPHHQSSQ